MSLISLIVVSCLTFIIVWSQDLESEDPFEKWQGKYNKTYPSKSVKSAAAAQKTYQQNEAAIEKHNKNKNVTYKQRVNSQADLTPEEIKSCRTGFNLPKNDKSKNVKSSNDIEAKIIYNSTSTKGDQSVNRKQRKDSSNRKTAETKAPDSIDFTSSMTPIKNQKQCGSCWAFAVIGVLEYWSSITKRNTYLSEQCLVDCVTSNMGCKGGQIASTMEFAIKNGVSDGNRYSYTAADGRCKMNIHRAIYKQPGYGQAYLGGNEDQLKVLLSQYGPAVVAINALCEGFGYYSSGVYQNAKCNSSDINHAVVLVGYGSSSKEGDFWIIRNSWGTSWGIGGYAKIARNKNNMCGIASWIWAYIP